jgi:protein-L-isoaspartate(D-aspartate) O-methyltransferase
MLTIKEEPKYAGMRNRMVDDLAARGIGSVEVLSIMRKIKRHLFIDKGFEEHAYNDKAFKIGAGQTISQPSTVAIQTTLLELKKADKVLEIGTGSGYQTAVLCEMGCKVFSIERQKALFDKTKPLLEQMGYRTKLFYGDGYAGQPSFAPFDKIIITCGAPVIPQELVNQLKPGGLMVIPLGDKVQIMNVLNKDLEGNVRIREYGEFRFVPMLEKKVR